MSESCHEDEPEQDKVSVGGSEREETPDGVAVVLARRRHTAQSWPSSSDISRPLAGRETCRDLRHVSFYVMSVLLLSLQLLVLLTGSVCLTPVLLDSARGGRWPPSPHCTFPLNYWVALLCMSLNWLLVSSTGLWWCLVRASLNTNTSHRQTGVSFAECDYYMDD